MALLRDAGITSALMHGGTSTIAGMGAPPDADAWTIRLGEGIDAPRVRLRNRSVSFSSARPGGVEHVMDPRKGVPASSGALAGACVGRSALQTDAWSTALLVRGERPAGMPSDCTSLLHTSGGWSIEGPDRGRIELGTQEVCL
jgi:thiamine biosynthesis lipoprotein